LSTVGGGWGRYLRWLSAFIVVVKFDSLVVVFLFFNIILFTCIEVTVMIKQAFVFLVDMSSYLWHGDIGQIC
jgi:hypothetical protein